MYFKTFPDIPGIPDVTALLLEVAYPSNQTYPGTRHTHIADTPDAPDCSGRATPDTPDIPGYFNGAYLASPEITQPSTRNRPGYRDVRVGACPYSPTLTTFEMYPMNGLARRVQQI